MSDDDQRLEAEPGDLLAQEELDNGSPRWIHVTDRQRGDRRGAEGLMEDSEEMGGDTEYFVTSSDAGLVGISGVEAHPLQTPANCLQSLTATHSQWQESRWGSSSYPRTPQ